jgi:hypothetical protein
MQITICRTIMNQTRTNSLKIIEELKSIWKKILSNEPNSS